MVNFTVFAVCPTRPPPPILEKFPRVTMVDYVGKVCVPWMFAKKCSQSRQMENAMLLFWNDSFEV